MEKKVAKPSRNRRRKILLSFTLLLGGLLLAAGAFPLWFPWVLEPVLRRYGVQYSTLEREGSKRVVLSKVRFADDKVRFQADQVETLLPTVWLWRHYLGGSMRHEAPLRITGWHLEMAKPPRQTRQRTSTYAAFAKAQSTVSILEKWLPKAALQDGVVSLPRGQELLLPSMVWETNTLSVHLSGLKHLDDLVLAAQVSPDQPWKISVKSQPLRLDSEFIVSQTHGSLHLEGSLQWQTNRAALTAEFHREDRLPASATLKSESFRVPAKMLSLKGYEDLAGSFLGEWRDGSFALDLIAAAEPIERDGPRFPKVEAVVRATGDTNSVILETLRVSAPWLKAELSERVGMNFKGQLLSERATLEIAGDLAKQPWIEVTGRLGGRVLLGQSPTNYPNVSFDLGGTELSGFGMHTKTATLKGDLVWPWLNLSQAQIEFSEGAIAKASGSVNLAERSVVRGVFNLEGQVGQKFLAPGYSFRRVLVSGELSGPFKKLTHAGHLKLDELAIPGLLPLSVQAEWRGEQFSLSHLEAKLASGESSLLLAGSGALAGQQGGFTVTTLRLAQGEKPMLTLEEPFRWVWQKAQSPSSNGLHLGLQRFHWRGDKADLKLEGAVDWPNQGKILASLRELQLSEFQTFFRKPLPKVAVDQFDFSGAWTNGPAHLGVGLSGRFLAKDGHPISAQLRATGNGAGIMLESIQVMSQSESVIFGQGFLPITFEPGHPSRRLQMLTNQPIDFRAATKPNPVFWDQVATLTRLGLRNPSIDLAIKGTLVSPQAQAMIAVDQIELKSPQLGQKSPSLTKVQANLALNRDLLRLNRLGLLVEGQSVRAEGEMPLGVDFSQRWHRVLEWEKASGRIQIEHADLAPFARFFPAHLNPQGKLHLDLAVRPGPNLEGEFRIEGAATRPLLPIGSLQELNARLKFNGHYLEIQTFTGLLGGEPLALSGKINLAEKNVETGLPLINLKLRGQNIPLVRRPELILRSDLDLTMANATNKPVVVSGVVNLRDSFYLSDLKPLIPGRVAKPKRRPPYFSIETPPLADWRLNLNVRGDQFLKVRSPLFRGEISSHLKVEGTLREPLALGEVTINTGLIQFPFSNLRVNQGMVSLTSDNPYRPQLFVTASSRTFGYEVKMEVTGPADQPVIEFSSIPSLSSEQIVLMVTTGEMPKEDLRFTRQQRAGRIALFLGKSLLSKFGAGEGSADRLTIRSGESLSDKGKQTYSVEYKLTDQWSIVGEYDRFNELNAGFKWKFYSK